MPGDESKQLHEAILQTLNRKVGKTYFTAEAFQQNLDAWEGVPLIYAQTHPDLDAVEKDLKSAVESVKGRIVGKLHNPRIAVEGHPRLVGDLDWGTDAEVEKLWHEGKLSHSTAFRSTTDGERLVGPVRPNHILLFMEDEKNAPGDGMAVILNKTDAKGDGILNRLKNWLGNPPSLGNDETPPAEVGVANKEGEREMAEKELEAKLEAMGKEIEVLNKKVSELEVSNKQKDDLVAQKDKAIAELQGVVGTYKQKEADARWEAFKAKMPKGMVHAEKEAESRKRFDSDPAGLAMEVLDFNQKEKNLPGEEGFEHTNGAGKKDEPIKVGNWNPAKGQWE
jgi:hypothetical protein